MLLNLEDRVREPARGKEPAALGSNLGSIRKYSAYPARSRGMRR
jgi:hypothetical protein